LGDDVGETNHGGGSRVISDPYFLWVPGTPPPGGGTPTLAGWVASSLEGGGCFWRTRCAHLHDAGDRTFGGGSKRLVEVRASPSLEEATRPVPSSTVPVCPPQTMLEALLADDPNQQVLALLDNKEDILKMINEVRIGGGNNVSGLVV